MPRIVQIASVPQEPENGESLIYGLDSEGKLWLWRDGLEPSVYNFNTGSRYYQSSHQYEKAVKDWGVNARFTDGWTAGWHLVGNGDESRPVVNLLDPSRHERS